MAALRRRAWLLISLALVPLASSQTSTVAPSRTTLSTRSSTTPPPSSTSSFSSIVSSRPATTFTVAVGPGGFFYKPDTLTDVHVNDTVLFQFYPKDHSVARAEYNNPCVPYESNGHPGQGFFSGTEYVDDINDLKNWTLPINSTEPIFFYCTAPGSCIDYQMVGVINPNSSQTLETQKVAAKNAKFMVAPGGDFPSEASSTLSAPSGSPTSATSSPTLVHHGSKLSSGVIAGIVVGAIAFLLVCAALFFYVGRTKSLKEALHRDATLPKTTPMTSPRSDFDGSSVVYAAESPFQPPHRPPEYGVGQTVGWTSPQTHLSVAPTPHQMDENKPEDLGRAEMPNLSAHRQEFTAELEAPIKTPRGYPY